MEPLSAAKKTAIPKGYLKAILHCDEIFKEEDIYKCSLNGTTANKKSKGSDSLEQIVGEIYLRDMISKFHYLF